METKTWTLDSFSHEERATPGIRAQARELALGALAGAFGWALAQALVAALPEAPALGLAPWALGAGWAIWPRLAA